MPAIGFLYHVEAFFSVPRLTGIALPTVVALLALGGGLVMSQRESGPLALLLRDDAGSRLVRRMLPVVAFVPILIGWLHVNLERGGLYDRNASDAVLVLAVMLLLSAMVWRAAVRLSRSSAAEVEAYRTLAASEEALRSSQEAYRHLVEGSGSVILRSDGDLNITYINSYGLAFFGYAAEELIGRNALGTIIPEADGSGRDLRDHGRGPEETSGSLPDQCAPEPAQGRLPGLDVLGQQTALRRPGQPDRDPGHRQ